ncbi:hypothetical protein K491DRAFT_712170 [Lophiostoma macrostomum CBS 122681]|uniref:Uncharacterized protein n=1 Tax=Lophiostoma macrostomum CBS 122681 TaxID=1314788 RepID=A0A6A6TIM3_9PLEO|nr:hypothetical protein K491DRAFT_712170 [Lophiostoma macrostomum CBS 122681]
MATNSMGAMTRNLHIFLKTLKNLLGRTTKWVLYRNCLIDFLEGGKDAQLSSNTLSHALRGNLSAMYLHNEISLYTFDATESTIPTEPLPRPISDSKLSEFVDILLSLDLVLGECDGGFESESATRIVHSFIRADEKEMTEEKVETGVNEDKADNLASLLASLELDSDASNEPHTSSDVDIMELD